MPHLLRILLTGSAFLVFFVAGGVVGRLILPLVAHFPGSPARKRRRREAFLLFANRWFVGYMRLLGLIRFKRPPLPPDLPPPGQPYVLIANHPTLIDVLLPLTMLPGLTSLFKPSWYRSWLIRPLLQYGHHIAGPEPSATTRLSATTGSSTTTGSSATTGPRALPAGAEDRGDETSESPVLDRMVAHLKTGHPLFVFPEGSRSFERRLRRFRRGAVEAAIRAQVPIVPIFISVNPVMLMKHQPWYVVPRKGGRYTVEFFPVIHTAGKNLDARAVNRELRALYEARHAEMLRERDADAAQGARPPALTSAREPANPSP